MISHPTAQKEHQGPDHSKACTSARAAQSLSRGQRGSGQRVAPPPFMTNGWSTECDEISTVQTLEVFLSGHRCYLYRKGMDYYRTNS